MFDTVFMYMYIHVHCLYIQSSFSFFKELMNRKFIEPPANVVPLIRILEELHLDSAADVLKDYMREGDL